MLQLTLQQKYTLRYSRFTHVIYVMTYRPMHKHKNKQTRTRGVHNIVFACPYDKELVTKRCDILQSLTAKTNLYET